MLIVLNRLYLYVYYKILTLIILIVFTANCLAQSPKVKEDLIKIDTNPNEVIKDYNFSGAKININMTYIKKQTNDITELKYNLKDWEFTQFLTLEDYLDFNNPILIVNILGPDNHYQVWKKEKSFGMWLRNKTIKIKGVPGYNVIASNNDKLLNKYINNYSNYLLNSSHNNFSNKISHLNSDLIPGINSIVNYNVNSGLLSKLHIKVENYKNIIEDKELNNLTLTNFNIDLPRHVPYGFYIIKAYFIHDKANIYLGIGSFWVTESKFNLTVFNLANTYPVLYNLISILLALTAGWLANFLFKNKK